VGGEWEGWEEWEEWEVGVGSGEAESRLESTFVKERRKLGPPRAFVVRMSTVTWNVH